MSAGREYWDRRAAVDGRCAVGYGDPSLYRYEERLRWAAFERSGGVAQAAEVLDVGCGVGAWSVRLAQRAGRVVAVDISPAMLAMAEPHPRVEYRQAAAHEVEDPDERFDLVVSVTVLQHIVDPVDFERSVDNLIRVTRRGGELCLIEYAPVRAPDNPPPHMRYRSRDEWRRAFETRGCALRRETGIRFLGERLFGAGIHALSVMGAGRVDRDGDPASSFGRLLRAACWTGDLALARIPGRRSMSDVRLMRFLRL